MLKLNMHRLHRYTCENGLNTTITTLIITQKHGGECRIYALLRRYKRHSLSERGAVKEQQKEADDTKLPYGISSYLGGDSVNLINEDDGGCVLPGHAENISDHARALAQIFLHELGAHHSDEGGGGVVCDCLGHHGLASTGGTIHQHTYKRMIWQEERK